EIRAEADVIGSVRDEAAAAADPAHRVADEDQDVDLVSVEGRSHPRVGLVDVVEDGDRELGQGRVAAKEEVGADGAGVVVAGRRKKASPASPASTAFGADVRAREPARVKGDGRPGEGEQANKDERNHRDHALYAAHRALPSRLVALTYPQPAPIPSIKRLEGRFVKG